MKRKLVYLCHSTGAPEDGIKLITDYLDTFRLILERKKFLTEHLFFGLKVVNMQFAVERRIAGRKIDLAVSLEGPNTGQLSRLRA